jgi:hypothetical protein
LWQRTLSALLRTALVLGATLLMLAALLLALLLGSGVLLWALLRGRRPQLSHVRWGRMPGARTFDPPGAGEVVDVQAREVPGPTLR